MAVFLLAWLICFSLCLFGLVLSFGSFIGSAILGGDGWIYDEPKLIISSLLGFLLFSFFGFLLAEIYNYKSKQLGFKAK